MDEILLAGGICLAAVLSGAFGLGFPLIAGPLFLWAYKPAEALLLTAICTLLSNILSAVLLRRTITYELRWRLIAPVLIGIPLGTVLVTRMQSGTVLRMGFGLLLVITAVYCLLPRKAIFTRDLPVSDSIVGVVGGVVGGMFAAPIALPAIWLNLRGFEKYQIRAILQPLVILSQVVILAVLGWAGAVGLDALKAAVLYVPSMAVGVLLGVCAFNRVPNGAHNTAVNVLVLIAGVILIVK